MSPILIIGIVIIIWQAIVTFILIKTLSHYNNLAKGVVKKNLTAILEKLLQDLEISKKDINQLENRCDTIEKDGKLHIQKFGLLRFNPFHDTGGDQSFILALLDGNETGVVISSLYSRSGARWYAKKIVAGKGEEHELSDEEKKAIKEAQLVLEKKNIIR